MKRKIPELDPPLRKHRPVTEMERRLWRELITAEAEMVARPVLLSAVENAGPGEVQRREHIVPPPRTRRAKMQETYPDAVHLLDKETVARLRRRLLAIEATFDLHGHTRHSGYDALAAFLRRAHAKGLRTVLVVTGKGKQGAPGVLRAELPRWLGETALRDYVMAYDTASAAHGGGGAFYVRLRAKRRAHAPSE